MKAGDAETIDGTTTTSARTIGMVGTVGQIGQLVRQLRRSAERCSDLNGTLNSEESTSVHEHASFHGQQWVLHLAPR